MSSPTSSHGTRAEQGRMDFLTIICCQFRLTRRERNCSDLMNPDLLRSR